MSLGGAIAGLGAAIGGLFVVQQNARIMRQLAEQPNSRINIDDLPEVAATVRIHKKDYDELKSKLEELPDDKPYKDPYKSSISMLAASTLVTMISEIVEDGVEGSSASKSRSFSSIKITINVRPTYIKALKAFFKKIGHKESISKTVERAMFFIIDQRLAGKREPYGYEILNAGIGRDVTDQYRLREMYYCDNRQADPVWQKMLATQKTQEERHE